MSSEIPLEMLVTVTFENQDGNTKMTLKHDGLPAGKDREGAQVGWSESFDKLAESLKESSEGKAGKPDDKKAYKLTLPTDREIVMERTFDAPRARVFDVYTDPKLIPLWRGRRRQATTVGTMDVGPGRGNVGPACGGPEQGLKPANRPARPRNSGRRATTREARGQRAMKAQRPVSTGAADVNRAPMSDPRRPNLLSGLVRSGGAAQ